MIERIREAYVTGEVGRFRIVWVGADAGGVGRFWISIGPAASGLGIALGCPLGRLLVYRGRRGQ